MLDRINPFLRIVCLVLAGVAVFQLSRLVLRKDPLGDLRLEPITSSTAAEPSAPAKETNAPLRRTSAVKLADLPPAVQARVDRITQSEILGPVVRPLPMALLGVAGKDALIRTPSGITGLMREGEELGGVKLLRVGTNRVLIEHESQQKELTVFSGFGGQTLLGEKPPQ